MAINGFVRGLSWDDFQGPEGTGDEAAFTKARFDVNWASTPSGSGLGLTNVIVAVTMVRSESWVREGAQTASLLEHEQGHYDITALGARDLDRTLAGVTASNMANLRQAVNNAIARHQREINSVNHQFDEATAHGTNAQREQEWIGRIRSAMVDTAGVLNDVVP